MAKTTTDYITYVEEELQDEVYNSKMVTLKTDYPDYDLVAGDQVFVGITDINKQVVLYEDRYTGGIKQIFLEFKTIGGHS